MYHNLSVCAETNSRFGERTGLEIWLLNTLQNVFEKRAGKEIKKQERLAHKSHICIKKLKGSIRFRFLDFKRIYFKVKIDFTLKKYHIAQG